MSGKTMNVDYLVIGAGVAGIGLGMNLKGNVIILDKNPFAYKVGESQIPNSILCDQKLLDIVPEIMKLKSYTPKRGSIFCDATRGNLFEFLDTDLANNFAFHIERSEFESFLAKKFNLGIREESVKDIDFENSLVYTDTNTYKVNKYILDCSGPAMFIANKLGLIKKVDGWEKTFVKWSYFKVNEYDKSNFSWAQWTVLTKVKENAWTWQIPLYNSSFLSVGVVSREESFSDDEYRKIARQSIAKCYSVEEVVDGPDYMKKIHTRANYAKYSTQASGKNWILLGDALAFADPIFSLGVGVAASEAVYVSQKLNDGTFDGQEYHSKYMELLDKVLTGFTMWYDGSWKKNEVLKNITTELLQGGYFHHLLTSEEKDFTKIQLEMESIFVKYEMKRNAIDNYKYFFEEVFFHDIDGIFLFGTLEPQNNIRIEDSKIATFFHTILKGKMISKKDILSLAKAFLNAEEFKDFLNIFVKIERNHILLKLV